VGPEGALPVVRFGMANHCGHVEIAAAIVSEGLGKPPKWTKDLMSEVKSLADEIRKELDNAGSGGSAPATTKPLSKATGIFK
jgi:hypothetical protein